MIDALFSLSLDQYVMFVVGLVLVAIVFEITRIVVRGIRRSKKRIIEETNDEIIGDPGIYARSFQDTRGIRSRAKTPVGK